MFNLTFVSVNELYSISVVASQTHENLQDIPEQQGHGCEDGKRGGNVLTGMVVM